MEEPIKNKPKLDRSKHKRGNGGKGLRPHVWLCGPDEYKHQMYVPWMMARAQANFRNESWDLEFEDYYNMWNGLWDQRGRLSNNLCMTRRDWDGAWSRDNVEIVTRKQHCQRQIAKTAAKFKAAGTVRKYKSRKKGDDTI
jgi:hypothetical protein